jgi:hypothetical protein
MSGFRNQTPVKPLEAGAWNGFPVPDVAFKFLGNPVHDEMIQKPVNGEQALSGGVLSGEEKG